MPDTQTSATDIWSWVSPAGKEYAIIATTRGTVYYRVHPSAPAEYVGYVDSGTSWSASDVKIYGSHAYVVGDGGTAFLQIVDLSQADNDIVTLVNTSDLGIGFGQAHNVFINEDSGFLYLAIPNTNGGNGITAVDLNVNPAAPTVAGTWTDSDPGVRCHDIFARTYTSGPRAGDEIAFCFAEGDGLYIVDVTNKASMSRISKLAYTNATYCHQGWLTDDNEYLLLNDELDEQNVPAVSTTTTYVIDVGNLNNPSEAGTFTNGLASTDHNLTIDGDVTWEANYSSGLRVWDTCDPPTAVELGYFDTRPEDDAVPRNGAWGVSEQLPSGLVLVSDRARGLFVLDPSAAVSTAGSRCTP